VIGLEPLVSELEDAIGAHTARLRDRLPGLLCDAEAAGLLSWFEDDTARLGLSDSAMTLVRRTSGTDELSTLLDLMHFVCLRACDANTTPWELDELEDWWRLEVEPEEA